MAEEASGFLGRWSRRKTDALQGKPLDEPAPAVLPTPSAGPAAPALAAAPPQDDLAPAQVQLPTLEDVQRLTKDSDFKPFMSGQVTPEVRNAAMKKLFADPHFNVMDGLDIYIDDYSKSDPIPESMLRQMASAKFLNLFEEEDADKDTDKDKAAVSSPGESANKPPDESVAQSGENTDITDPALSPDPTDHPSQPESLADSGASQEDHAHTDMRLQPDHAAPAPEAGRRTQ